MKILGISGTLVGSKTSVLVQILLNTLQEKLPDAQVEFLDLKDYQVDFCDGRPIEKYNEDTQKVINKISEADAFIIGTTILHGSMPGVLKNLFELVPIDYFTNKCILLTATGGNHLHYLAVESYIKPVANYLKMYVLPEFIYATSIDFNEKNELTENKAIEVNEILTKYASFTKKLTD